MSHAENKDELDELFASSENRRSLSYSNEMGPSEIPGEPEIPVNLPPLPESPVPLNPAATTDEEFLAHEFSEAPGIVSNEFISFEPENSAAETEQSPNNREERSPLPGGTQADPRSGPSVIPSNSGQVRQIPLANEQAEIAPVSAASPTEKSELSFASDGALEKNHAKDLLLDSRDLVKIYDGRTVVNQVSINVKSGEIVGLLGPNGAGKTTSFYMIVGLVPENGGKVFFNGTDVTSEPMYVRARLGMGYLPQEESIFRKLTVEENILAVLETLKISKKERKERCEELLERFSITHIRNNLALTCSGGEKRRLTIARSLVTNPSLLMLDEPFSGVDPIAVNEIQNIVQELRQSGLAILITDHNARQTLELVDRAYLIFEGKVLREGARDFLVNDPVSRELYLGDRFTM